ncbi:MAG: LPS-assembly protein LptD [Candidatus Pelagibacter bacterium]|nr:LPS-assembly protein LptD [Candidatus Pelagibacter bacterium]MBL6860880.1 LPS-assembly protein LptD [Candidatus Pelagibacter bacterium]
MKNSIIFILLVFFFKTLHAESLLIQSKKITLDKDKQISIFQNEVYVQTDTNHTIESDYAEYNKKKGIIKFKKNVKLVDNKNNIITTDDAEYNEYSKIFRTNGPTKIVTAENYIIKSKNIILDKKLNSVVSKESTTINDVDNNLIELDNFSYEKNNKIFKSVGLVSINDKFNNTYKFSQLYIDTQKKEMLGSDVKAFLDDKLFKINEKNNPRIMANTLISSKDKSSFNKSIFTLCGYRKSDDKEKCPPWTIQASKMLHDNKKKTIYYDNAIIKVYNIPVLYLPKFQHPDPSVHRRSGFLPVTLNDTKNLGSGLSLPYYLALNKDKDFTFTNNLYVNENPLFMGEYRQAFKNSNLILDMGYTEGYKKTTSKKLEGEKSHLFSEFTKIYNDENLNTTFSFKTQDVSNDKYLKLYKIKTDLIDYNQDYLENSLSLTHSRDDYFLSVDASIYENLKDNYVDKYEYNLPEIVLDKNLFQSEKLGTLDLQSNLKVNNYDTNKTSKTLINDLDWESKNFNLKSGLNSKFLGKLKNVNYETSNIKGFKQNETNEIHGVIGYFSEVELIKKNNRNNSQSLLTPKMLIKYSPGSMKKENNGSKLTTDSVFSLDRSDDSTNLEKDLSAAIGFDYKLNKKDQELQVSLGQIISRKENKKMASVTSLDEKLSDLVGSANLKINQNLNLEYNFLLDQNYNDINYNEIISTINYGNLGINLNYLQEKNHIGANEYIQTDINYQTTSNQKFALKNKRNLVTNSSEYYDLSYEYYNDCLRAALVYRREFYNDSELEAENSLMFKITLIPFGKIDSPSFSQ